MHSYHRTGLFVLAAAALFAAPVASAPVTLIAGGVDATVTYYPPHVLPHAWDTYHLDTALTVVKNGGNYRWNFHWDDGTIRLVHRNENSLLAQPMGVSPVAVLDGNPVNRHIRGKVMCPGEPQRDLTVIVSPAKGYIWGRGQQEWPDAVHLQVYETFPTHSALIYTRYAWMGTRATNPTVWTPTGGWTTYAGP